MKITLPNKLKVINFHTFKDRKDKEIRTIIKGLGYNTFDIFGNKE